MEYEKILNLLDNTPNQPTKFKAKNWIEINNYARGTCNTNSQIKFKTSMLKSILFINRSTRDKEEEAQEIIQIMKIKK